MTKQHPGNIRFILTAAFLLSAYVGCAQTPIDVGSTSATDHDVRVHSRDKAYTISPSKRTRQSHTRERAGQPITRQKLKAEERGIEREGRRIQKQKPHRTRHGAGKVARVFKRHNHFSKKEAARSRSRSTRRPD